MEQALKNQIITVFESIYFKILNNDMVGFAKKTVQGMLDRIFLSYGRIRAVELENNSENISNAWDPKQLM